MNRTFAGYKLELDKTYDALVSKRNTLQSLEWDIKQEAYYTLNGHMDEMVREMKRDIPRLESKINELLRELWAYAAATEKVAA